MQDDESDRRRKKPCRFLSTEHIVQDLNHLDGALAVMLRSLEIRDVRFLGVTYGSLTYPAIFLQDLVTLTERCNETGVDSAGKKTLTEYFSEIQPTKQRYAGFATNLPNAGDFKCEKLHPTLCGDIVVSSYTAHAMKDIDMSLALVDLMAKCQLFWQDRVKVQKCIDNWSLQELDLAEYAQQIILQREDSHCLLTAEMAPSFAPVFGRPSSRQTKEEDCKRAAHTKKQALKEKMRAKELEFDRTRQQDLRETMLLLAKCTPIMQNALRPGCTGLAVLPPSVAEIRTQWEQELQRRMHLKSPHPADLL